MTWTSFSGVHSAVVYLLGLTMKWSAPALPESRGPTIEVVEKSEGAKLVITMLNGFPQGKGVTLKQSHAPMIMNTHVSKAV